MLKNDICPRAEHPNPQWERTNWKNLNGQWLFEIDNSQSGENRKLYETDTLSSEIILPFCPESELSGIGNKDFMMCVWYKKVLSFTEDELCGNKVILHFGAADFRTKLWVNSKKIGMDHIGGYGSFEYDITSALIAGDNLVTVACYDNTRDPHQPRGKQSELYYSHGCDYTRTTGIWQTVWYEIVPENYIKRADFYPDANNCALTLNAELVGSGDLSAEVFFEGKKVGEACKKSLSVIGQLEIALSEKHLWELGDGKLYDIVLRFGADEVKSYFGLRSIELKDGKFLLNGRSVFQRLILDQGFYHDGIYTAPTDAALKRDIELSMAAGFNGARLHQKVFEPRFLYHADKLGYLVWGEYGSWGLDHSDIVSLSTFLPDWTSIVKRDFNHPAIIGWCPFNETWEYGPQRKRQDNELIRTVYEQTKLIDPTRPCIDTSGGIHVVTDIYDTHDYEQSPEVYRERYAALTEKNEFYDRFAPRQQWKGEPLFLSEYGGIGFALVGEKDGKKAWCYGNSTQTYEEFYERYRGLTHTLLDNPKIMGFCYTQLTDVEQELNGLFFYKTRESKFDLAILHEINSKKAAIED